MRHRFKKKDKDINVQKESRVITVIMSNVIFLRRV
jgi:hypothetical protein